MRKILSLVLGLLWVLPALADLDPCRNLLNTPERLEISKWYKSTGTIVSTDPDTRRFVNFSIQIIKSDSDTPAPSGCAGNFYGPVNNFKCKFTTPENTTSCRFYSNGERVNSGTSIFPCEPNTQYTFSMDVISANPTIRNGIIYSHMQLEKGDTATEFTPACTGINVATTKYTNTQFEPLDLMLSNAISVVDTVVSNTITQAASIATLQTQKQTRPNDIADDSEKCPAGKKCLLVEDASGIPHWYEIVENAWDLPVGYTQLQYIESTGTQWIDTGITPSEANNIYIRFKNTTTNVGYLIGATNGSNKYNYVGIHGAFRGYGENWGGGSDYKAFNIPADTTTIHTIEIDLRNTPQFYFDSVLKATQSPYETINSTNNLIINANVLGTQNRCSAQYYEVKLSNNGTLIRDFVPAKNPDGKIGMYDKVNGVFYENQGTGEFIAGAPVSE